MSSTTTNSSLTGFWHDLPRAGKLLLSVVVLEFLGTGLVLPFHVVYLNEVRGFSLSTVGLLLGISPLAGFLIVGPGGAAIDRLGARKVLMSTLVLLSAGNVIMAQATTVPVAAFALVLTGLAYGMSFPASQSLIAVVIPSHLRQRYYGVNFALLNLGIGIGGILGGLFVDVDSPITFEAIYLADAISYLPAFFLLLVPLRHVAGRVQHHLDAIGTGPGSASGKEGYLAVLRRPAVASLTLLTFAAAFVGYAQLNTGMPAFARAVSEISTEGLGFAFAANTLVIVLLQLVVLKKIEGHRRTRVIGLMGLLWALSWLVLGTSGLVPGTVGATVLVAACASVFALGETLMQPTIPALVNDLAPDHLRGRYNAVSSAAFNLASITAPALAGFLIQHSHAESYIALLVVGSIGVGVYAVTRLEREVPAGLNGIPVADPETDLPAPDLAGHALEPTFEDEA